MQALNRLTEPTATDISVYCSTSPAITQNVLTVVPLNTEVLDSLNEFNNTTYTFTPGTTGTYLISFIATIAGFIGRNIAAVLDNAGTTAVSVMADGTLVVVGGTQILSLTGGTGYKFGVYTTGAGASIAGGAGSTFLRIRRLF